VGEIIVGVALLTWVAVRRLRQRGAAALAVSATAMIAIAFLVTYRLELIAVLP
jgi:hypothetical protein